MKWFAALLLAIVFLSGAAPAQADSMVVNTCGTLPLAYKPGATRLNTQDINGNGCISGSFSASIAGFRPTVYGTPIAATTAGVTGSLPAGTEVVATNVGTTNGAYCALGGSATTSDQYIAPNGGWFAFAISGDTQLTCITSTSTTTVNMAGGSGIPTGTGGGGGGGGSGGTVAQGTGGASAWLVTGTGGTFPVTGTFWQTTQPVSGTFWQTTQPVSVSSLPLPSEASTSENQTNASQKTQIVDGSGNVIGSTSNALNTNCSNCSGSGVSTVDGAGFTAGTSDFVGIGGQYTSGGASACATTKQCMAGMTADRSIFVNLQDYGGAAISTSNPIPVTGIGIAMTGVALGSQTGSAILGLSSTNAPTATTGDIWPVSISPVSGGIRIDLKDTAANTNPFAMNLSQVLGSALSATNPVFTRPVAGASGGCTPSGEIAPNNATAVVVKSGAGTVCGVQVYGLGSAPAYLKLYNATSATCGSGTPVKRLMIPAASTAANGAGSNVSFADLGVAFSTGITYCVTTGIADTDTTAPAASTFIINVDYI